MKLTKYEHACLILEKAGSTLVIDPGSFTMPLADLDDVVGIVITHEHADHWTPEQLARVLDRNPEARILGPAGVATAATEATVEVVSAGDEIEVGPFGLKFFGEKHAVIHESIPVIDNLGVLVEDTLYYGGDSYTVPEGVEVDTLAAPAGAPWLKVGEVMDYVVAVAPKRVFPVHEATLSQIGRNMVNARLEWAAQQGGGELFVLEAGESSEI
jgi:L-ascorbate metabolism protein UlaG (beta-lactamase superfamily)